MHFLTYVFIGKDTHINKAVAEALQPYGDDFEVKPWKRYLEQGEIEAMAKCYKLPRTALRKLAARMEDWNGGRGGVDRGGLYAVLTYNPDTRWDWYEIGGRWDGWLKNNAITARTLLRSPRLKALLPHDFLTPDGRWHAVEKYVSTGWLKGRFVRKSERRWLKEFTTALAAWPRHRVVCVDRHN
ncbi:MAG: hypothetical protein L0Z62_46930 [Gemmataceae bacterium]|nr:hypothetical protein [Gemmataceae bacterium]